MSKPSRRACSPNWRSRSARTATARPRATGSSPRRSRLRDRVVHRWLAVNRASRAEGKKHVYYLSLEFLIGRLFADMVENLPADRDRCRRARRSRRRSRPDAPRRARRRARQWRSRPARRMPDGKHGEPWDPGLRLRHPLRPRAVPPGDPRRLAAGISPRTGCPSATRGSSRGRKSCTTSSSAAGSK